jgi:hypothetical protein
MPAIRITSRDQYIQILEVLHRIGGTWQGVGGKERYLLVTPTHYQALLEAKVIPPENSTKDSNHAKKSRQSPKS